MPNNPVVHLELHTGDRDAARDLYAALCGWRPATVPVQGSALPYLALEMGRRLGGGIVECPTQRPVWLPYVEVGDIAKVTERAAALGATVLLDTSEGPHGWRSVVATPTGGEIAFWQPKR